MDSVKAAPTDHVAVLTGERPAILGQLVADGALYKLPEVVQADGSRQLLKVARHGTMYGINKSTHAFSLTGGGVVYT